MSLSSGYIEVWLCVISTADGIDWQSDFRCDLHDSLRQPPTACIHTHIHCSITHTHAHTDTHKKGNVQWLMIIIKCGHIWLLCVKYIHCMTQHMMTHYHRLSLINISLALQQYSWTLAGYYCVSLITGYYKDFGLVSLYFTLQLKCVCVCVCVCMCVCAGTTLEGTSGGPAAFQGGMNTANYCLAQ